MLKERLYTHFCLNKFRAAIFLVRIRKAAG
jgi:hypothetical protein